MMDLAQSQTQFCNGLLHGDLENHTRVIPLNANGPCCLAHGQKEGRMGITNVFESHWPK